MGGSTVIASKILGEKISALCVAFTMSSAWLDQSPGIQIQQRSNVRWILTFLVKELKTSYTMVVCFFKGAALKKLYHRDIYRKFQQACQMLHLFFSQASFCTLCSAVSPSCF